MKITTLIKVYDVLVNDGYRTNIIVNIFKNEYAFVKLTCKWGTYKESFYSTTCSMKYILQKLDGRPFESRIIE